MRNVCLVTNYNYAQYLGETLRSVAAQTHPFDLVLIVDDGSSDGSARVIDDFCRDCSYARAICKENGGQLSSIQAALPLIEQDDLVFFLDADDSYPPDYLARASRAMAEGKAAFMFVEPVRFRDGDPLLCSALLNEEKSFSFGPTSALTRRLLPWIGEATSCLCLKGGLLKRLLPYPFERDWVTRADDVLIFGASILGAHKLYVPSLGVNYRMHGTNNFAQRELTGRERAEWRLRHERLRSWYCRQEFLPQRPPLKNALHEAVLIPGGIRRRFGIPSPALLCLYDLLLVVPILRLVLHDLTGKGR